MKELIFKTDRPIEEIQKDFEDNDVAERMMASLQQALDFEQGKECPGVKVHYCSLPDEEDAEA